MDYDTCSLYCQQCKDYIYDVDLAKIVDLEKTKIQNLISLAKGI